MGLNYLVIGFSICIQAAFLILCRPHTKTQPRVFRGGVFSDANCMCGPALYRP